MKNNFLLIGGAGFIGSNITKKLLNEGKTVVSLDTTTSKLEHENLKQVIFDYYGDDDIKPYVEKADWIIFLVCNIGPQSSMDNPELSYGKNISKLIELLELVKVYDEKRVAFVSSGGTIYGEGYTRPISEAGHTNPINNYGILKLTQEKILLMYNRDFKMRNVIFRFANPYGVGQRLSSGVGAITAFMRKIIVDEELVIYGTGEDVIRDYIYIDDAVNITCKYILSDYYDENDPPIYNVGTGIGTCLNDILKCVEDVTEKRASVKYLPGRMVDVKYNVLDSRKLLKVVGEYEFISLKDGIKKYYFAVCEEDK